MESRELRECPAGIFRERVRAAGKDYFRLGFILLSQSLHQSAAILNGAYLCKLKRLLICRKVLIKMANQLPGIVNHE